MTERTGDDEDFQPLADIWATVELERALRERGRNPDEAAAAVTDPHLGARVVVIARDGRAAGVTTAPALALAEPTTEGRLAASLARNGEGSAGLYVALPDGDTLDAYRHRARAAGIAINRVEPGPFGRSVLLLAQPVTGPHQIVVERRSIPSRP